MKITTTTYTRYSKSPVINLESKGRTAKIAVNVEGNIYRMLKYGEDTQEGEPVKITLSGQSVSLIENWKKYVHYSCGSDLDKLHIIQQYYLGNYRVIDKPLHSLNISEYYLCSDNLEAKKQSENYRKEWLKVREEKTSLLQQVNILQAKLKVPAKMAEMNCTDKQALAYVLGGKLYHEQLKRLFAEKTIHPNSYTGSGRYTSKGSDKAAKIANILTLAGIKHNAGNDAPKGGFSGNFIKIN